MNDVQQEELISNALSETWELFSKNFVLFILAGLLHSVVTAFSLGLLGGPLTVGFITLIKKSRRGETVSPGEIFSGLSRFVPAFIASLIFVFLVALGFFFLVLPGIILAIGWIFTFQIMESENTGPWESMSRSWGIFRRQAASTLVVAIVAVLLNSVGAAFVFGTLLSAPFSLIFLTVVYEKMSSQRQLPEASLRAARVGG